MEEKLKTGSDLGLDWKQLAEVWELRNHESKFYTVNEVNGCIEIDPNHLLTVTTDCPKERITQFNNFITDCKTLFKQLILDANINSETNQLLAALRTAMRIETKTLKNKKYQCAFTKELSEISVTIYYNTNTNNKEKEKSFQKSIPVAICPRMLLWLQSMYVLKYITDNLSKNSESAIRLAWEMIHPLASSAH
jgi:hypothetical protein